MIPCSVIDRSGMSRPVMLNWGLHSVVRTNNDEKNALKALAIEQASETSLSFILILPTGSFFCVMWLENLLGFVTRKPCILKLKKWYFDAREELSPRAKENQSLIEIVKRGNGTVYRHRSLRPGIRRQRGIWRRNYSCYGPSILSIERKGSEANEQCQIIKKLNSSTSFREIWWMHIWVQKRRRPASIFRLAASSAPTLAAWALKTALAAASPSDSLRHTDNKNEVEEPTGSGMTTVSLWPGKM